MTQKVKQEGTEVTPPTVHQTMTTEDTSGRSIQQVTTEEQAPSKIWNALSAVGSLFTRCFSCCRRRPAQDKSTETQKVVLTSPKPSKEETAAALRKQFEMDPSISKLPKHQQERIFNRCLEAYKKSVDEYEKAAGVVAFQNPKAKEFAKDLSYRLAEIVSAYSEILEDENPSKGANPLFTREFMMYMRIAERFGNESVNPGSVGMSPLTIIKALKGGNMREQMTLAYRTVFSFFAAEILDKPGMIDKVNAKLKEQGSGFQIDKAAFEKDQKAGNGIVDLGGHRIIKQAPIVDNFRNVEKMRVSKEQPKAGTGARGQILSEVPGLSLREARVGTRYDSSEQTLYNERNTRRLEWVPGKEWNGVDPTSTFAKEARALGNLPILTGPSGTTDGFLHVARYLGLGDRMEEGALACVGWMVPVGDHTLHEIRSAANEHGVAYEGLPEDFQTLASSDPTFVQQIEQRLADKGLKNPSYYFSPEFQHIAGRDLGVVDQAEVDLDITLANTVQGIQAYDHVNLDATTQVKSKLKSMNLELRQLEAIIGKLDELNLSTPTAEKDKIAVIRARKDTVKARYNSLKKAKIDFVKGNITSEQRVYAMSNPRVLKAGTDLYTCNKAAKIQKIVYGSGFSEFESPDVFHSGYASDYVETGRFGMNEMGEIGHYFSIGNPGYMSSASPHTLHVSLKEDLTGTSIMSVTELKSEGFTKAEIEEGYRRIHQDYPYLQNDGFPPKGSEVVFVRPQNKLNIVEVIKGQDAYDEASWTRLSVSGYAADQSLTTSTVHSSWTHVTVPKYKTDVERVQAVASQKVDADLTGVTTGIQAFDHVDLTAPVLVKQELKAINLEMRQLEALYTALDKLFWATPSTEKVKAAEIRSRKAQVVKQYNELKEKKIKFVKLNISTEQQVYAMSNPRVLKSGTDLYTCNKAAKIQKIVYGDGFAEFTNPKVFHSGHAKDYVETGRFGMNEMGEIGHYFSIGSPGYMSTNSPHTLHASLNADLTGTSIMSVTELKSAGFTKEQIEEGYRKIHQDYPYLQNDGLPPKDSEVVVIRPQGKMTLVELIKGNDAYDEASWTRLSVANYAQAESLNTTVAHGSWAHVDVPTYQTETQRVPPPPKKQVLPPVLKTGQDAVAQSDSTKPKKTVKVTA